MKTTVQVSLVGITLFVGVAMAALLTAWHRFPERHARSCLETIEQLTNDAVSTHIPQGEYRKAIEIADYIESYYPIGSVLKEAHPFAEQYRTQRAKQIERILEALRAENGMDREMK